MNQFPATKCVECGNIYGHRTAVCRECLSEQMDPHSISGHGTVYATTTIRVPGAEVEDDAPYEVCVIDVGTDETARVTARLTDRSDPDLGDDVQFVEERRGTFYFETHG
ncbi:Zn-ribbon domain-containing OB-fold protein [Halalkalicoccus sp. NIPERK01]|uniref:Zn-ribbon domain-containing OB-fold protein n=1 Tax=Halalkalicoccus sp. NIPERK01 TaxID=3053469 RepID=UPI00256F3254|nr:OB-fold domain-containing protein [Halalkalicoccus sp. NIPERK01]MDL5363815.1 OB-fold domain-containing protein [Halalkalicoccus sp. NIPERK01]